MFKCSFTILKDLTMKNFDDTLWTLSASTVFTGIYEEQVDGTICMQTNERGSITVDSGDVKIVPIGVRSLHQALLAYLKGLNAGVYCKVHTLSYPESFTYLILRAEIRKGVLWVKTINGWEVPLEVYVSPLAAREGRKA